MAQVLREKILEQLHSIARHTREQFRESNSADLSMHQIQSLLFVRQQQPVQMSQLASMLQVTAASATIFVNRLVAQGWMTREQDEKDRRKVYLTLSQKAEERLSALKRQRMRVAAALLDRLSEDELKSLHAILIKLTHTK